jgi:intracellular multiplication protein IcmO
VVKDDRPVGIFWLLVMAHDRNHEVDQSKLRRDTRSGGAKFFDALYQPTNFRNFLCVLLVLEIWQPFLWPVWIIVVWTLTSTFKNRRFRMPLRMPKDLGFDDVSDYREEMVEDSYFFGLISRSRVARTVTVAGGILYLGYLRSQYPAEQGREMWLTNSDARTHLFLTATTGGGKSETLLGVAYNALSWGSGCVYADGKASANVPFCLWSLARRLGREDDFVVLNFLTGGEDPFQAMIERDEGRSGHQAVLPQSNSMNSFSDGSADFLLQLMASIIPKASGESQKWQQRALNMIDAVLRTLCYKRARGEVEISVGLIRHYLALPNLVQLYLEGKDGRIPELAFLPIKAYFETGLPGFNSALAHDPTLWDPEVYNQHGYLTGEFARTLSMLMDTYGHIFQDQFPDVDISDVLQNNRILVVMIPSMEKSASEAAALGKLYVSALRLSMAQDLGHRLEGTKAEILDTNATNAPNPSIIINDELQAYFAEGIATLYAQARELNYMMVASTQDVQGLKRGEAGKETGSLIANTKIKWTLPLEDPEDTFELFRKAGGDAYYGVIDGYDAVSGTMTTSYRAQPRVSIQKQERIRLSDLKKLNPGEGIVIFKDAVVPCSSFFIPDDEKKSAKLPLHINRFLQITRPDFARLPASAVRITGQDRGLSDYISAQITRGERPYYPALDDPILAALSDAASHMDGISRFKVNAVERGIVLFQAAQAALKAARTEGKTGYCHSARAQDDADFDNDESI